MSLAKRQVALPSTSSGHRLGPLREQGRLLPPAFCLSIPVPESQSSIPFSQKLAKLAVFGMAADVLADQGDTEYGQGALARFRAD